MNEKLLAAIPENINVQGCIDDRTILIDLQELYPFDSLQIIRHSPYGFNWGYSGSGPSQLALAIYALRYYQAFKKETIALWPQQNIDINLNLQTIVENIIDNE